MRNIILTAMALSLLGVDGENIGDCVEGKCFVFHPESLSFDAARIACQEKAGDLITVKTEKTADVLAGILKAASGHFWLGLRRYSSDECSDSGLRGYTWVTGPQTNHYSNWRNDHTVCAPLCVSMSQDDLKWHERHCEEKIDGFLCEIGNPQFCQPLKSNEGVLYSTPLGFTSRNNIQEIPQFTNATVFPLRTKHICVEADFWLQAPWSCEVFNGGCDYKCQSEKQTYSCICLPGFKLDDNKISCSRLEVEPGLVLKSSSDTESIKNPKCKPGFRYENNVCVDEDECGIAPCEHECANTEGSYECVCFKGYTRSTEDMHKCKMQCFEFNCTAECDSNNNAQCNCPDGFILENDRFCVDLDECISTNYCDEGCTNTPGSYECLCAKGFVSTDDGGCEREDVEGSGNFDTFTPTSVSPTATRASISAGSLMGITICVVVCLLLLVCFSHFIKRRLSKTHQYDIHKGHEEIYNFQQVITDDTFPESDQRL
ncbi:hypothetical protein DNTS_007186 [Danionella cerebrum]|uniref:Thrombomodulin n=1 Tax=Danionella cerebrum TaxID=2873325 RepID=A0A553N4S0_9TELE|nr:hypothetical protein DNTS_007186 [Danionella translucida]